MSPTRLFQTTVQLADIVTRRFEELGRHEDYPVVHKTAVEKGICKDLAFVRLMILLELDQMMK